MALDLVQVDQQVLAAVAVDLLARLVETLDHLLERREDRGEVGVEAHRTGLAPGTRSLHQVGAGYRDRVLERLDLRGVDDLAGLLPRPSMGGEEPLAAVREILGEVRERGDAAVREYTARFDGVDTATSLVPTEELHAALVSLPPEVREALELAESRIAEHHRVQLTGEVRHDDRGIRIRSFRRPVGRAGCYVPGGRAAYPSTLLMTAVPARVAGVPEVVVCVPPDRATGRVSPVTLAAAAVAGVEEVHAIGGAQAVGAMAYGTESVAPVDVICGPGNAYVALAKAEVAGTVGVAAAFAGPSEVVVIADGTVPPEFAAIDVILQAEHGPDGLAWLITWDPSVADAVSEAVDRLTAAAPRRDAIAATLSGGGYAVVVDDPAAALRVANLVAPEHLELLCADAESLVERVDNAGAVFLGPWSPASVGDYLAGPSHVLPTYGSARFASALTVDDFLKHHHVISVEPGAYDPGGVAGAVETLARAEGLDAHADSIRLRRDARRDGSS